MNSLIELQNSVMDLLAASPELEGIRFVPEFPDSMGPAPARGTMVGVGIAAVDAQSGGFGDYLGLDAPAQGEGCLYGKRADVTLRFSIYAQSGTGAECSQVFFAIAGRLLFWQEGPAFHRLSCDAPVFDREMQTVMLTASAACTVLLTQQTQEATFSDFSVRRETEE